MQLSGGTILNAIKPAQRIAEQFSTADWTAVREIVVCWSVPRDRNDAAAPANLGPVYAMSA